MEREISSGHFNNHNYCDNSPMIINIYLTGIPFTPGSIRVCCGVCCVWGRDRHDGVAC